MIVARPMRGAEGMGAAMVAKGHCNTTYTACEVQGKGRRRERDRERAQMFGLARERDPMRCTGYMDSAAPGVDFEVRDPAGLMGVKSTNSPDRVEIPPTPPRSRRRDRRSYSPITSSSDEEPPQSTRKLELEVPANPTHGNSLEPVCNLAVLTKSRRKTVLQGLNLLGEHDKAPRTLFSQSSGHNVASICFPGPDDPLHRHRRGRIWTLGCQFCEVYLAGDQSQPYHHCSIIPFMG